MPGKFEKLGISFQYPENWTLDEEDALAGCKSVTLYSPGGGFWSVAVHPGLAEPADLAKAAADALCEEYEEVELEYVCEELAGCELIGYDLNFYCLDLTNSARIRCLRTSHHAYSVFCQAEDREFKQIEAVFQAMTVSLTSGLKDLRYSSG